MAHVKAEEKVKLASALQAHILVKVKRQLNRYQAMVDKDKLFRFSSVLVAACSVVSLGKEKLHAITMNNEQRQQELRQACVMPASDCNICR